MNDDKLKGYAFLALAGCVAFVLLCGVVGLGVRVFFWARG